MVQPVSENQDYIARLKLAIQEMHQCEATYRRTVSVHETFHNETLWKGNVEIFWLTGHPRAKRCFAWTRSTADGKEDGIEIILEVPPVIGAATAVRMALALKNQKL